MSGPKVVRVVTREERLESCERLLAQLDAAIRGLKAEAVRFDDAVGIELTALAVKQRDGLVDLVRQDSFDLAERQIQVEVAFVSAKRTEVIDRAASAAATARRQLSQQRHAATTLLKDLERRAPAAHAEFADRLREIAGQSRASGTAESVLAKAMMALTMASPGPRLSEEQKALASSLQSAREPDASSDARSPVANPDKRISDLQLRLSQIEVLKSSGDAAAFTSRLDVLELEAPGPARSMKLDALVIDVASMVEALKRMNVLMAAAKGALAEVDALDSASELSPVREALLSAIGDPAEDRLKRVIDEAADATARIRGGRAAAARRQAILAGLASLGYQVNENMATSWVDDGRVVLRKSDADMHGVEIASAPDAHRLQVRAVAFSSSLSALSNLAAEETWCGDFGKLQEHLAQHSGELAIERAMPVGAVPLKVVQPATAIHGATGRGHSPKTNQAR